MSQIVKSSINRLRISHKKLVLIANLINEMPVDVALRQLEFSRKRISSDVRKCLVSAIANAEHNYGHDIDLLYVSRVIVGKSTSLKRMMPRARGRGASIIKRFSNIRIEISQKVQA